ncbi:putative vacuolar morphogenesis protein 7 [Podospora australis]|uniref:Vacuolar morphogenesis protein 7 n=1 Tax=Podospora australis TaxID=1536484 RepID=A0AAN6WV17_9PEZI|nr:putative vacuolar morphogenesis protein 7 [Podospora australis]
MAPPAEISIPTTSLSQPSDNSKPFTLYNIILRLPLRSFVVQKRYSDFVALHQQLTSLVGHAPPEPLPGKFWFRSTVSSPELTENRRVGLEKYLRAIAEPPDRRWRDTPAWRAFLNLPPATAKESVSGVSIEGRIPAIGLRDANVAAASDPGTWLDLLRELKGSLHEARVALGRRDAAAENSVRVEAGSAAKRALVKAGSLLSALTEGLRILGDEKRLGEGELRRRRDLLAAARVERDGLDKLSSSYAVSSAGGGGMGGRHQGVASASDRAALMGGSSSGPAAHRTSGGRVLGAPLPETERTRELDNEGVLLLQRTTMEEQDEEVATLARIVRRQKEMGLAINDEVNRHIDMLDRLNDDTDVLGRKLGVAKDRAAATTTSLVTDVSKSGTEPEEEDGLVVVQDHLPGLPLQRQKQEQQQQQQQQQQQPGGGVVDAVLLVIVRCVLAGVEGYTLLEWLLGKISEALVWLVELGMLLVMGQQ